MRQRFPRPYEAAAPLQDPEAVSHPGQAAAEVAADQRVPRPDRLATRRPQVAADTLTDTKQFSVLLILQCSAGFQASLLNFLPNQDYGKIIPA